MNPTNIMALFKAVVDCVKLVESLLPASAGKDKLDAVLAMVEQLFGPLTELIPKIASMVTVIVATFNAIGVFKKSS